MTYLEHFFFNFFPTSSNSRIKQSVFAVLSSSLWNLKYKNSVAREFTRHSTSLTWKRSEDYTLRCVRMRDKYLTARLLLSYIYVASIFDSVFLWYIFHRVLVLFFFFVVSKRYEYRVAKGFADDRDLNPHYWSILRDLYAFWHFQIFYYRSSVAPRVLLTAAETQ